MLAVLRAVATRLDAAGIEWRLAGSTARLLRGAAVRPGDIDLEVREADGPAAARALALPAPVHGSGGGWSSLRSQGVLHGVPIDLSAGLTVTGPGGSLRADDASVDVVPAPGLGGAVALMPPGESLARAIVSANAVRREKAMAGLPRDPAARDAALAYCDERVAAAARAAR